MRAVAKILRARASEHSSNFCEQFEQRPNFASTSKFNEAIRYPYYYIGILCHVYDFFDFSGFTVEFELKISKNFLYIQCRPQMFCQPRQNTRLLKRRTSTLNFPWGPTSGLRKLRTFRSLFVFGGLIVYNSLRRGGRGAKWVFCFRFFTSDYR